MWIQLVYNAYPLANSCYVFNIPKVIVKIRGTSDIKHTCPEVNYFVSFVYIIINFLVMSLAAAHSYLFLCLR